VLAGGKPLLPLVDVWSKEAKPELVARILAQIKKIEQTDGPTLEAAIEVSNLAIAGGDPRKIKADQTNLQKDRGLTTGDLSTLRDELNQLLRSINTPSAKDLAKQATNPDPASLHTFEESLSGPRKRIAAGILAAIVNGNATGKKPQKLEYHGSLALQQAKRRAALADYPPLPTGMSYDEYPFASTTEGGKGAYVTAVPKAEQDSQGGALSTFYGDYVPNGGYFWVQIVP